MGLLSPFREARTVSLGLDRWPRFSDFRRVPRYYFDVLVVGGGAAGAAAALAAARRGVSVAVICKRALWESNTRYAQGGVAAVQSPEDSFESHIDDTLRVGCGLSERAAVETIVRGGPEAVRLLIDSGAALDRHVDGSLDLMREGGHSHRRIVHAKGDTTGVEIQVALSSAIEGNERIAVFPNTFVISLIPGEGCAAGCLAQDSRGEVVAFLGSEVVLATGGAGQIFRETTNPALATGDGVALAFRAGCVVRDLEFFQFHPTCLYIAGAARVLISEIVRGAGGVLRDRNGVRFMPDFHPDADLAPRDIVSRAVFRSMVATEDTNVYLDLSEVEGNPHRLFPGISHICGLFGIDIARDPVPVRPGAHYMIGGIQVDADGRTTVPSVWAVGECASSGVHGANRMGSNSLLEALVLGTRAGTKAAEEARPVMAVGYPSATTRRSGPHVVEVNIEDVTYSLKFLMWRQMGIEREGAQLEDALTKISLWSRAVEELAPPEPPSWQLVNMLLVSRLASLAAAARQESRGVHYRTDYPEESRAWRAHTELHPIFEGDRLASVALHRSRLDMSRADPRTELGLA